MSEYFEHGKISHGDDIYFLLNFEKLSLFYFRLRQELKE